MDVNEDLMFDRLPAHLKATRSRRERSLAQAGVAGARHRRELLFETPVALTASKTDFSGPPHCLD